MSRSERPGIGWIGYLFYMLCASVLAVGCLFLVVLMSYVYIIAFFLSILSLGVGHG